MNGLQTVLNQLTQMDMAGIKQTPQHGDKGFGVYA